MYSLFQTSPFTTSNTEFDELYKIAIREMEQNTVSSIKNNAFNNEQPIPCPPGGCFQAGQQWTYVWTRDTSYAVHLALAALKPQTALNSLMFKTSVKRSGNNKQSVQDTGTGGSYPISSDRVVWALGAAKLLHYLSGQERAKFESETLEIVKNTIEHDRHVIFDEVDGLYCGEQSFLDWRQQTYPGWVSYDVIHVGMSKCLSTNLLHLNILNFGADLAQEKDIDLFTKYRGWAENLKQAIRAQFYLPDTKLYSTFITTYLDNGPAHQYDLLGSVLAILLDVATPEQSKDIIANYPVLPYGPPVIWPQQQFTPIYHNRAIWPFVTAYWIKAARKVENVAAVNHGIRSLINGVQRHGSNRENFEMVSGATHVDEGATSGPVVNSQAQLWSIAGYLSMVHDIIFGQETSYTGIRFLPCITTEIRKNVFAGTNSLTLNDFPYRGKTISVTVNLPDVNSQVEGIYQIVSIKLNGRMISQDSFIPGEQLQSNNQIEIQLSDKPASITPTNSIRLITDTAEWRNLFAPLYPIITSVDLVSGKIQVSFQANGQNPEEIAFNIYRDGQLVQGNLPGSTTVWIDPDTNNSSPSYCYTIESYFCQEGLAIANHSQKSSPVCYWGPGSERVNKFKANVLKYYVDDKLQNQEISWRHDYPHYENWGKPKDTLVLESFQPTVTGFYLLQVSVANGSGPVDTGITCAVKFINVYDSNINTLVGSGYLIMPQISTSPNDDEESRWKYLRDSSFVRVKLEAGRTYTIVISENEYACNMSYFDHFKIYNGQGGQESFNRVNIASLKILALADNI